VLLPRQRSKLARLQENPAASVSPENALWDLIPSRWSKPLKEMKLATFNARAETVATTTIIAEPNKFVAEVQDRMPVLLNEKDYEPWLSRKAGLELLKPGAENVLQKWPVSRRVNSSRAPDDDPTLIDRIPL
jgi:putative SOS response-associated peptidase YedK